MGSKRIGTILGLLAVAAVVRLTAQEPERTRFTGTVVNARTGQPLRGIQVGAIRTTTLARLAETAEVKPEGQVATDQDGVFRIVVPATMPGLDAVILFTITGAYIDQISGGVTYKGALPTAAELRDPRVTPVDIRTDTTVGFELEPDPSGPTQMVPMRDGTLLATDVHKPEGEGPWPVVLLRTPYGRAGAASLDYVRRGYVVVAQDVRGRFESEGENLPFLFDGWSEHQDGIDTINWVAAQPWCNGKIATAGGSALGITQVLTAAAQPEHVVCQAITVACGSLYHDAVHIGGGYSLALFEDWTKGAGFDPRALELMQEHSCYDDWWRKLDANARAELVNLPGLFVGGWYDIFTQGTIDAFLARQTRGGPGARGRRKLLMGPWPHGKRREVGELTYPANALLPPGPISESQWIEYWLKGADNGVDKLPAVTWYVMGACGEPEAPGNEWRTADVWPPAGMTPTPYYLHSDGTLDREPADGAPLTYTYDPTAPVPTRGGNNLTIPAGPMDQREVENRADVLLFTSAPLTEPLEITGPIKARLWVSSSAVDTDFTVKLTDVYPDGRSMLVIDGIRRMRHRNSFEREELMTPGTVYEVEVDLWSTSLIFNAGHRIRVAVSSSNYRRFGANRNTGKGWNDPETVQADNTLHLDRARPSQILLPVMPR